MGQRTGFRIPTILAIALVGGLVTLTGLLSDNARLLFGRAAQPSQVIPNNVTVTNITDTSALIYWKSEEAIASTVRMKNPQGETLLYDTRDSDKTPKPYKLHVFILENLLESSTTSFEIYIGRQPVYKGTISTGPLLERPPQVLPIYGSIPSEIDDIEKGVLVTVTLNNEATWTTFQYAQGRWVIPLATLRAPDRSAFYCDRNTCNDSSPVEYMFISEGSSLSKTATIGESRPLFEEQDIVMAEPKPLPSPTVNLSPSPSKTALATAELLARVSVSPSPTKKLTPTPTVTLKVLSETSDAREIMIVSPKEGANLSFSKPLIRGTGIPKKEIAITLAGSITQIGKTKINDKGIWQWTPGYPLDAGAHKISVVTTNQANKKITLTQSFNILKSGESVLSASTPSATLVPIPTEAPVDTTPVSIPTATPTLFVTAGPAVSLFFVGGGALLLLLALTLL